MAATKAFAKHDQQKSPTPTRQAPQGRTYEQTHPEHVPESSPHLHRYLGNRYLQTKLNVNKPDIYEKEADRVADQMLATPAHHDVSGAPPRIQRFSGQSNGQVDEAPASVDQALASPGRPLGLALRQDMDERFGYDFSNVRVHTGAAAEQSAQDVNAHAYTMGHDIVFGAGGFAPETHAGRSLLTHELTHVVHQASRGMPSIQRKEKEGQYNWTTVTQITVEPKTTGRGRGRALTSDGQTLAINIEVNTLSTGRVTTGKLREEPKPNGWSRIHLGSMGANRLVYLLPPGVTVAETMTIVIEPGFRERQAGDEIKALAPHIQDFLMKNIGARGSYEDLQSVANAGFILEMAGVTEDELELSLLQPPKTETSDLVGWALTFVERRAEQEQIEKEYEEREQRRKAEEKRQEKFREKWAKYPDEVLDKKLAQIREELEEKKNDPESYTRVKPVLARFEKEWARRRDVRRAKPVTGPETVSEAVNMLEEAWRDAEKEEVPDVKRALKLVSHIDEWLQETASSDKYERYFKDGMFRTVARQAVGTTKTQIHSMRFKLQRQGEDDWSRATHLGGHWELGINSLKYAREYLEVMGAKKSLEETSLHGLQETSSRATKYMAAGYAAVVVAPIVIAATAKAAPLLLTTQGITAAGLRVAPRIMLWAARHPILATEVGTAVVGTALQVGEDKYLDPLQLVFNILHIYAALPRSGPSGPPAPNVPRQEGEPDFIITGAPKVDQQTGKVTASVIEQSSGRQLDAEVNITTANGQIIDRKTREVVGIISNGEISRPAPALPVTPSVGTPKPVTPTPPVVPALPPAPLHVAPTPTPQPRTQTPPPAVSSRPTTPGGPPVAPAPKLAGKTQAPPPAQVTVPIVSAPRPKNENITARTDFEKARDKRAAATRRPRAQTQRQVLAATGGTSNVAPAKVIGSGNAQGDASRVQIVASGEGKPPGSGTPVPGSVRPSSETATPTTTGRTGGPPDINRMIEEEIEALPPPGTTPLPEPANQNVISRPPPGQAPPPSPAPPHQVHPHVLPGEGPVPPPRQAPSPQPAPPAPEVAPAPPGTTSSRQPGSPEDDFENATTLVSPRQPADPDYEPPRSLVRRSGRETDQNLRAVSGEIAEPPAPEVAPPPHATTSPRQTGSSETDFDEPPVVRKPAVTGEPAVQDPVSKAAPKLEKFDFHTLPVPEAYRNPDGTVQIQRFGVDVMRWGNARNRGAQQLVDMIQTNPGQRRAYIEHLRREGVTPEMARAWAAAYEHELVREPDNTTAAARIPLLHLIADVLSGKSVLSRFLKFLRARRR